MRCDRAPRPRHCLAILSLAAATLATTGVPTALADPVIVAAGDIACPDAPCLSHRRTARLIGRIGPRAVLTLGDNQYSDGALDDYRASYDPTWGRFRGRTYPTPGNHDYHTPQADGYFDYFGARAHRASNGMYSVNIGRWHVVSINSGRGRISDRQLQWVRRNLRSEVIALATFRLRRQGLAILGQRDRGDVDQRGLVPLADERLVPVAEGDHPRVRGRG